MHGNPAEETVGLRSLRNAEGQILNGLEVDAEQWEATAAYLVDGQLTSDDLLLRKLKR